MKTVSICQPHYIPWIGYFEMIDRVDLFVFLDDVDYIKREWKNRNKIRGDIKSTKTKWLSIPIEKDHQRHTPIHVARIADTPWRQKHLDSFQHVYRKTRHFDNAYGILREGLNEPAESLGQFNQALVIRIAEYLGITTTFTQSSTLQTQGKKTDRLISIAEAVDASAYIANNGSSDYLEVDAFHRNGIDCSYQDYEHPEYFQWHENQRLPFLSHLSVLDLIANHGPDSLGLLRQGRPSYA